MNAWAYRYKQLPPGEHFRYLVLQPGTGDAPLICSLVTAPLAGTRFEAISYVWGSSVRNRTVWCEGRPLRITTSLHQVLCRLRYPDAPRQLWADGLCINQDDTKEKGHQVGFMSKIYKEASRVLMYVGSDSGEDGERVSTLLRDLRCFIDRELQRLDTSVFDRFPFPASDDPVLTDPRWDAMNRLVRTEWFDRGWVVREAALAQSGLLIWGQSVYDWGNLMTVMTWAAYRANPVGENVVNFGYLEPHMDAYRDWNIDSLQAFLDEYNSKPRLLLDFLSDNMSFSNPCDRIYAFLDLITEPLDNLVLNPNYDLSTEEVFHDFAEQYIHATGHTGLLDYVVHFTHAPQSSLPSWVPKWDLMASEETPYNGFKQMGLLPKQGIARRPEVIDRARLKVHAVMFDFVRFISEVFHYDTTKPEDILHLMVSVRNNDGPSSYPSDLYLNAFFKTLVKSSYPGDPDAWLLAQSAYVQRFLEHKDNPSRFEWESGDQDAKKLALVHEIVRDCTKERRFMVTQRGYMGLAPAIAQEGDLCSIIFGCQTPSLIRPTAVESRYTFLGNAYVLGSRFTADEDSDDTDSRGDSSKESIFPNCEDSDDYGIREEGAEKSGSSVLHSQASPSKFEYTQGEGGNSYIPGYFSRFGEEDDKEWTDWAEEQDIYLV
jgi:hypothetical protein